MTDIEKYKLIKKAGSMINLDKELGAIAQMIDKTMPESSVVAAYVAHWRSGELAHRSSASIIVSIKASADRHTGATVIPLREALAYQALSERCGAVIVDALEGVSR